MPPGSLPGPIGDVNCDGIVNTIDAALVLQFDGHSNDAGFITRCEAYLDSKGFLRCQPSGATAT